LVVFSGEEVIANFAETFQLQDNARIIGLSGVQTGEERIDGALSVFLEAVFAEDVAREGQKNLSFLVLAATALRLGATCGTLGTIA